MRGEKCPRNEYLLQKSKLSKIWCKLCNEQSVPHMYHILKSLETHYIFKTIPFLSFFSTIRHFQLKFFKEKENNIFWEKVIFLEAISLGRVMAPSLNIITNLPRAYIGKDNRIGSAVQRDPSVQTHRHSVTFV